MITHKWDLLYVETSNGLRLSKVVDQLLAK